MKITKESIIGDVLDFAPDTAQFFFEIGMHCLGCPSARGESIADACAVHGVMVEELLEKLNEHFLAKIFLYFPNFYFFQFLDCLI